MKLSDLVQSGAFSYLAALPPHPGTAKEEGECQAGASDDFSLKLEQIRRMHNLKGDRDIQIKPAHINQLKLPVLSTLIRKLVEQRFEMELGIGRGFGHQDPNVGGSRSSTPALSEDRKSQAISVDTLPHFIPYLPSFSPSCLALSVPSSVEDLRIPSYKPASAQQQQQQQQHPHQQDTCSVDEEPIIRPFGKVNETSRIGDTLKDIIAKTISEKVKFRDADSSPMYPLVTDLFGRVHPVSDAFSLELGKSAFHACRADISQPTYPAKRIKREAAEEEESGVAKSSSHMKIHSSTVNKGTSQQSYTGHAGRGKRGERSHGSSSHSGTSSSKGGNDGANKEKKTRPKRGQYRKYNSQLLIEAVRAVQRGEMSVHRAGSYFGVPHSTLEYKVKERHLLRQKKPPSTSKHSILSSGSDSSGSCSRFSSQHQGGGGSVASADVMHTWQRLETAAGSEIRRAAS
nr:hypothetical protein BaRGS_009856 [Batillaria attramentaria]